MADTDSPRMQDEDCNVTESNPIPVAIFDLDGTLADCEHRRHYLDQTPPDWDGFFAACDQDVPIQSVINTMLAMINAGHRVEIWSGRDDAQFDKTVEWLVQATGLSVNEIEFLRLTRMRPHGNYTPDVELKRQWLHQIRANGFEPMIVFDDRASVVAMWRDEGVVCAQVAPGEF